MYILFFLYYVHYPQFISQYRNWDRIWCNLYNFQVTQMFFGNNGERHLFQLNPLDHYKLRIEF
jgi:hypothetical protein